MRKLLYIICILLISNYINAQQLPHYSLYMYNDAVINPAITGTKSYDYLTLTYRNQWASFEGAPKTQMLSYQRTQNKKIGLGAVLFNDATGPISRTGAQFNYAYRMPISKDAKLSLGLAASVYQYLFDNEQLILHDDIPDPAVVGGVEKALIHDATFGFYYYTNSFYFGTSIPHLIQSEVNLVGENQLVRHYFINSGYRYNVSDKIMIEPSFLFKTTESAPFQYDFNLKAHYNGSLWSGISYRNKDALIMMLGVDFDSYSFGYSYDKSLSDISTHNSGSHGAILTYRFGVKKDSDKDGVEDERDDCPYTYGLLKHNGCPDTDSDGVVDKLDECPKSFGVVENNGCPLITEEQKAVIDTAFTNLEFVFNKSDITFSSYSHLENLGLMLEENPLMKLKIVGHTDNIGNVDVNLKLSKARANAVKVFLTNRGIEKDRIVTLYFGKEKPIASNETKEGRAKNRRVELSIFFD